jgi:hypothetical protein
LMVSISCSPSDRGCVTFVMVISSCYTSGRDRVIHVMVRPLVEQEPITITKVTRPLSLVE